MSDENQQLNFPQREEKILEFWEQNKIFEKSLGENKKAVRRGSPQGKIFVFYEGPPTANAGPGIHHLESRAFKDIIPRYKTMRGFLVPRKAGWDTHGLPVEIQVEKALGLKIKKDIEKYGIAEFNKACREAVWKFKKVWDKSTKRLGFWLDLEHPYITYETSYIESLWWIIKNIWKKGFLYRDFKVVPWCPRCETGLSTHELGLPGAYKLVKENSVFVKLKIKKRQGAGGKGRKIPEYLLVWTTTPWTLPANVAVAVNPAIEYTKYKLKTPAYAPTSQMLRWASKASADKQNPKVKIEEEYLWSATIPPHEAGEELEVVEKVSGRNLIGFVYEPLFNTPDEYSLGEKPEFTVFGADFVSTEEGTGMVHIAPAFGDEDMSAMKTQNSKLPPSLKLRRAGKTQNDSKIDYPIIHTVNYNGTMKKGVIGEGKFVKEADAAVIEGLTKRGLLYRIKSYEHDYPHCWRCSTPLLYFAKNAWWIKMTALKEQLLKSNSKINWIPEHVKEGRFGEFLRELRDWAFSRERFWGTPLPVWQCEKCGSQKPVGSLEELAAFNSEKVRNNYFVLRHGEALHNIKGTVGPSWPEFELASRLTLKGRKETEKAAKKLVKENIDLIFSSSLFRTKETAEIVALFLKKPVVYSGELRDYDIGAFHGKTVKEFHKTFHSVADKFENPVPGGESWNDVRKRMVNFLLGLEKKYRGKNILVISHGDPLWLLNSAVEGLGNMEAAESGWYPKTGEYKKINLRPLPFDDGGEINIHRPYVDKIFLKCVECGGRMKRVSEVIDVWFDSGAMPFAQGHWPFAADSRGHNAEGTRTRGDFPRNSASSQRHSALRYPADYISEAVDQTRGWFYTLLAVATLLGKKAPYKNVVSLGLVLDKNGQKMSKSKGNIIDPELMINKYGADAVRWYFYTVNSPGETKRFDEKDLQQKLRGFLGTLWNSFVLFDTYVDKVKTPASAPLRGATAGKQNSKLKTNILDEWVILKTEKLISKVTNKLDKYDITGAAREIEEFVINDFSNWYLRRSRRRFQKPRRAQEKNEVAATTAYVLVTLIKLSAPFVPFITDIIWQELRKKAGLKEESVHLADWPEINSKFPPSPRLRRTSKIQNSKLLKDMEKVREIVAEALKQRATAGIKVRQPLGELRIKNHELRKNPELQDLIKEEVNVKEIAFGKELKLDTTITSELKEEGMAREIIRNLQEMRKDLGLHPKDKIRAHFSGGEETDAVLEKWKKFIMAEAGVKEFGVGGKRIFKAERDLEIDGKQIWIGIDKTN